jgi:SAM-dependent methyltransferase
MPQQGRFANFSRPCGLIWFSICRKSLSLTASTTLLIPSSPTVHWKAFTEAVRRDGLAAFVHLRQIRDAASAKLFSITCKLLAIFSLDSSTDLPSCVASGFIAFEDTTIVPSLVEAASGVVLELGPGPGNQIHRYNYSLVDYVYGVEPNPHFKDDINAKLEKHSLQDRYKLVVCGIEDSDILREEGITEGSLDTVLCIQVLCAVKDPKTVMKEVWKLLKPGGKFIFWEHGWSRNHLTIVEQGMSLPTFYFCVDSLVDVSSGGAEERCRLANMKKALLNPAWSTFVGCHMTRDVLSDILKSGEWENPEDIEEPEDPFSCLPRIQGVLIKKA